LAKDKFIIIPQSKGGGYKPAMIDIGTHELLSQMRDLTGVSMTRLIEQAVKFSFDRIEIKED
jgi:hypothetical protein